MTDLHDARREAADEALADHEFEPDMVTGTSSWNTDDDRHDEWTCVLSMDGPGGPYACGFIVRFGPGTAIVGEAYPGDPHRPDRVRECGGGPRGPSVRDAGSKECSTPGERGELNGFEAPRPAR